MVWDTLVEWNAIVNGIVWGLPVLIVIFGGGLATSIILRFAEFRHFGTVVKTPVLFRGAPKKGEVKPWKTITLVIGGTVGVGNIAGVSTAVALGGAGAVFWMLVMALLGMSIKAAEVSLSLWSRKMDADGKVVKGGTMYYIDRVPIIGGILATLFALFGFLAAFGIGNMVQTNSVAHGVEFIARAAGITESGAIFNIRLAVGIILVFLTAAVIWGGLRRIADAAYRIVPFMCIWYVLFGIILLLVRIGDVPGAIGSIIRHAFTPQAAVGGFAGATVFAAIRFGFARGLFSNEAGMGSAPLAYAYSESDHPGRMGFYGMFEVLIDTFLCMITGLVVVTTGAFVTGETGAALAMTAFKDFYGVWAAVIIGVALALVAFSTLLTWCFYGMTTFKYFFTDRLKVLSEKLASRIYRALWLPPIIGGAIGAAYLADIWDMADTLNGLMVIPNLVGIIFFLPIAMGLLKHFIYVYLPTTKGGTAIDGGNWTPNLEGNGFFARWRRTAYEALTKDKQK